MSDSTESKRQRSATTATPPRDEQAHRNAVRALHEQADRPGLFEALDAEPTLIYQPLERPR